MPSSAKITRVAPLQSDGTSDARERIAIPEPLRVVPVQTARELRRFIKVPWKIYAGEPNWIPPLLFEQRHQFTKKNPFFQHARAQFWIAYRGAEPVGRISAQ